MAPVPDEAVGEFIFETAGELRAGVRAQLRRAAGRVVHVVKSPQRALTRRRFEREQAERRAEFDAKLALLREQRAAELGKPVESSDADQRRIGRRPSPREPAQFQETENDGD